MSEASYADINNGRGYPAITRAEAFKAAQRILRSPLGSPELAAVRTYAVSDANGGHAEDRLPTRGELMLLFRRWLSDTRQLGSSKGLGRTCWASSKPSVGHHKGWGRLIHDVSHMIHEFRHPLERPHGPSHHQIERDVSVFVETSGMLDRKPTPAKPTAQAKRAARYCALTERRDRWAAKLKRADRAVRKLNKQIRALERAHNSASLIEDTTHAERYTFELRLGRRCYFCDKPCDPEDFCHGCREHICEDCGPEPAYGHGHSPEDHQQRSDDDETNS